MLCAHYVCTRKMVNDMQPPWFWCMHIISYYACKYFNLPLVQIVYSMEIILSMVYCIASCVYQYTTAMVSSILSFLWHGMLFAPGISKAGELAKQLS